MDYAARAECRYFADMGLDEDGNWAMQMRRFSDDSVTVSMPFYDAFPEAPPNMLNPYVEIDTTHGFFGQVWSVQQSYIDLLAEKLN